MRRLLLLLALALGLAPLASAADDIAPDVFSYYLKGCDDVFRFTNTASTGTPDMRLSVQDAGSGATGLRIGRMPHVGGASALTPTVLLLHFDNTFTDDTPTAETIENTASVTFTDSQANFTRAGSWPGTAGEYVRALASADLNSTTDQLTLQAWVYPRDQTNRPILEFNDSTTLGVHLEHSRSAAGDLYANFRSTDNVAHVLTAPAGSLALNTWSLVTMTWGTSGASNKLARLYVNDVLITSATFSNALPLNTSGRFYIGHRPTSGASFYGYIDEVRVLSQPLGVEAVANDYYGGQFKYSYASSNGPFTTRYLAGADYSPAASNGSTASHEASVLAVVLHPGNNYVRFSFQDRAGNTIQQDRTINVQTGPPASPSGGVSASVTGTTGITWSWGASAGLCTGGSYRIYPCNSNTPIATGLGTSYPEAGLGVNSLNCRRASAVTGYGESTLTGPASAYTWANPPTSLSNTFSSTGSLSFSWSPNGNPTHTRWEMSLSIDNFATLLSSPIRVDDNFTAYSKALTGLSPQTAYYMRLRAINGSGADANTSGDVFTSFLSTTLPTHSAAGAVVGQAQGTSSILWSWNSVPTAVDYTLFNTLGAPLTTTGGLSYTQNGLSQNVEYGAFVRSRNATGFGPNGPEGRIYTLAAPPGPLTLVSASSNAISVSWSDAGNPAGATAYEVFLSTDPGFAGRISTYTVAGTNLSITGLLPSTDYSLRARALNGNSVPTSPTAVLSQRTADAITVSSASTPQTPYGPLASALGVWHFDESGGTKAVDSSGLVNDGQLTCTTVACSTPTFTSGQSGLGNAVRFNGLQNAYCRVPHAASLAGTGSVSVQAWVNPTNATQIADAGIVTKGSGGRESFALVVTASKWRFFLRDAGLALYQVSSTQSIQPGRWTHLAGVYDASARTLSIYVDGTLSAVNSAGIPAARFNEAHEVSIGARKPAAAGYDSPFNGTIDEVSLAGRAMSATEVSASWSSGRSNSALDMPSPNTAVRLYIPPNAFGGPATVYVSSDPAAAPIQASAAKVLEALSRPPTGQALIPGTLIEVLASVGGLPLTGTLSSSVTLSLPYADADGNGLVDDTIPPIPAAGLRMYTLDETVTRWVALPTSVDAENRRVLGQTPHFSVFAVFGPSGIRADASSVRAYPVPWQPGSGGRFDSASFLGKSGIVFDNLPRAGTIKIFNIAAELVADVAFSAADVGTAVWDGRNRAGRDAASGVYFAYVKSVEGGTTTVLKLAVER